MQKLVVSAAAVAAALALFLYFARSNPTMPSPPVTQALEPAMPAAAEPTNEEGQHSSKDTVRAAPMPSPATDEQKLAACAATAARMAERGKAMLAAEPKDPAWAYSMEQKLREFTSRRFRSSPIDVVSIDCRTYYCDVKAQTFDAEKTQQAFTEGIAALREETWARELTGMEISFAEEGSNILHVARMSRPWPAEMTRAFMRQESEEARLLSDCSALTEKQEERRRQIRDKQERDASWADPMEYRLREYMTAHLSKLPVDHLDIDCRTTFCRLQASGRTNESQTAFQKAAEDASKEPWADLWYAEVTGQGENGIWDGSVVLYRRN